LPCGPFLLPLTVSQRHVHHFLSDLACPKSALPITFIQPSPFPHRQLLSQRQLLPNRQLLSNRQVRHANRHPGCRPTTPCLPQLRPISSCPGVSSSQMPVVTRRGRRQLGLKGCEFFLTRHVRDVSDIRHMKDCVKREKNRISPLRDVKHTAPGFRLTSPDREERPYD
jgi:hypothetical protein